MLQLLLCYAFVIADICIKIESGLMNYLQKDQILEASINDVVNHPEKFYNFFRMTNENVKKLVYMTGPSIEKKRHFHHIHTTGDAL